MSDEIPNTRKPLHKADASQLSREDRQFYAAHDQSRFNPSFEEAVSALNRAARDAKTADASSDPELRRQIERFAIDAAIRLLFCIPMSEEDCRSKYLALLGAPFLPVTTLMMHLIAGALRHDSDRLGVRIELKTIARPAH
jgi:hypothetical protein